MPFNVRDVLELDAEPKIIPVGPTAPDPAIPIVIAQTTLYGFKYNLPNVGEKRISLQEQEWKRSRYTEHEERKVSNSL